LGYQFEVKVREVDEVFPESYSPLEGVIHISKTKAFAFKDLCEADPNLVILAADTVVVLGDRVIGKPQIHAEAVSTLTDLSGQSHQVITACSILHDRDQLTCYHDTTIVKFKALSRAEIDYYIEHYQPFDKAGAYGIQEWIGLIGIERIQGSYTNVVGLPTEKTFMHLRNIGINIAEKN